MTKEQKQYLKENEPWNYEAFYGDPVTGRAGSDDGIFTVLFCILCAALGLIGLIDMLNK